MKEAQRPGISKAPRRREFCLLNLSFHR